MNAIHATSLGGPLYEIESAFGKAQEQARQDRDEIAIRRLGNAVELLTLIIPHCQDCEPTLADLKLARAMIMQIVDEHVFPCTPRRVAEVVVFLRTCRRATAAT